jgi:hypothetical protein
MTPSAKSIGRRVGVLLIVQGVLAFVTNFVLLKAAIATPAGFLATAAAHATELRAAVLLLLLSDGVTLLIAMSVLPVMRRHSEQAATWFVGLALLSVAVQMVENVALLTMLSASQQWVKAGASGAGSLEAMGAVVRSARVAAHFTQLLVATSWLCSFFLILYRFALIPRALAALGLAAIALLLSGVELPYFFGYRSQLLVLGPAGLVHLAFAVWLLMRGFEERAPSTVSESRAGRPVALSS